MLVDSKLAEQKNDFFFEQIFLRSVGAFENI